MGLDAGSIPAVGAFRFPSRYPHSVSNSKLSTAEQLARHLSPGFLALLDNAFPRIVIKSDTPVETIKWNAAQRELIDFLHTVHKTHQS